MRPSSNTSWLFINIAAGFVNTVVFTVAAVYFVQDVGANPFQLVFIGTVMEITVFLFEIPTGAFADTRGRRRSVIVGFVIQGGGLLLVGVIPAYGVVLLGYVLWGLGATFHSGALEAWVTDELPGADLERVFLMGERAWFAGSLLGLGVSVALASVDLALPFVVGGALDIALGMALIAIMREDGFTPTSRSETRSRPARDHWNAMTESVGLVRTSRWLTVVLAIVALLGMHSESLDRLWEAHLLNDLSLPPLGQFQPVVWFGIIGAVQLLLGIVLTGLLASRRILHTKRDALSVLVVLVAAQMLGAIAFAVAGSFVVAIVAFVAAGLARALIRPLLFAWINRRIESHHRATVLSIVNSSDAVGQWVGGPIIGAVGTFASLRTALLLGAGVLLPGLPLLASLRADRGATPRSAGPSPASVTDNA
jgi:MFS transporter, DHA3 family, tetracycline resistance protein